MSESAEKIHYETYRTYAADYVHDTDGRPQLDVCREKWV